MNTIIKHNHKRAEALRSLSLEPSLQTRELPVRKNRRLAFRSFLLALVAGAAITAFWPDIAPWPKGVRRESQDIAAATGIAGAAVKPGSTANQATARSGASNAPGNATVSSPMTGITGSGYVVAPHVVTVFSKYEGQIASVAAGLGDRVETGQLLVAVDDVSADFALEQAKADSDAAGLVLAGKILALDQASRAQDRSEALSARNAVSVQTFEEARTARDIALNAVDQARQTYRKAQLNVRIAQEHVDALNVKAPISGTVTRLDAHVGGRLLARLDSIKENESLLTITDTKRLVIDADVAETNIGTLRPGLRGEAVLDGFPDKPFAIEIAKVWPVASAEKGTITLRLALLDPPDRILPNMAARIRIAIVPPQQPGDIVR